MARRNRYKEMENLITKVLIGDAAVFVLYLLFAGLGVTFLKVVTAIIAIAVSGLCLAFLYLNGEIKKRRSRWMVAGAGAVLICLLVSLLLNYPSPAKEKPIPADPSSNSSVVEEEDPAEATQETGESLPGAEAGVGVG